MHLMKLKSPQASKKLAARSQTGNVNMPATASGLTSQAGLIPVIKEFLQCIGFDKTLSQTVPIIPKKSVEFNPAENFQHKLDRPNLIVR